MIAETRKLFLSFLHIQCLVVGLDLLEQERRWDYMQQGRGKEYHGIAVHPRHLSLFEKGVLGIHHQYNPQLDAEAKKAEASHKVSQRLQVRCSHVHVVACYIYQPAQARHGQSDHTPWGPSPMHLGVASLITLGSQPHALWGPQPHASWGPQPHDSTECWTLLCRCGFACRSWCCRAISHIAC